MKDAWTFSPVSGERRTWDLKLDHMRVRFSVGKTPQRMRGATTYTTVSVQFSREVTERTSESRANMYANAEKLRFMAQMYDTAGDLADEQKIDVRIEQHEDGPGCTLTGDDALTFAAVYFGNEFAEAVL